MAQTTEEGLTDLLAQPALSSRVRGGAAIGLAAAFGWLSMLALAGHTNRYLRRRNLCSCILLQALVDGFFLLLLPALLSPPGNERLQPAGDAVD